jgi:hypothetical protein
MKHIKTYESFSIDDEGNLQGGFGENELSDEFYEEDAIYCWDALSNRQKVEFVVIYGFDMQDAFDIVDAVDDPFEDLPAKILGEPDLAHQIITYHNNVINKK